MKTRYILFAMAILALASCNKQNEPGRLLTLTASLEDAGPTKATVQNGGTQVYWEPGDAIKVFYGGDANRFESQCTGLEKITSFVGTLNIIGGANEGAEFDNYIWGLYPYRADATSDGESVSTTLPASQTGRAGSFAQNTNISLAHSSGSGLAFYNVCGGIRFSLTQSGIKRVILESNNGEPISGEVKIGFESGLPVIKGVLNGDSKIILKAPDNGTFETGVWYYIVALPGTLANGFKLTLSTETGSGVVSSSSSVTIKRGIFGSLANVDAGVDLSSGGSGGGDDIFIDIDGEFYDWANVPNGLTGSSHYYCFKVHNDANYIYFYSKRDHNTAIWNTDGSQGYFYYDLDTDNNSSTGTDKDSIPGLETWLYIMPFGGTPSNPAWYTEPRGSSYPSSDIYKAAVIAGSYDSSIVEIEVRLPLSVIGVTRGSTIGIYSWGNKSAADFKTTKLVYTVK